MHEKFMLRCLDLAKGGIGLVEPNPYVGCVIVQENQVVSEGFHHRFGGPHAEVEAIRALPSAINPSHTTLYVNLEPCSHYGKTPPCADLITQKGFKLVVIAMQDPNPLVGGNGIKKLQDAGIQVEVGICEKEARELNRRFITFHTQKRPYIILKWAQTRDGFIDLERDQLLSRDNFWITTSITNIITHQWRSQETAIMIGKNTLLKDNPQLNVRHYHGKNPTRILVSSSHLNSESLAGTFLHQDFSPVLIINPHVRKIEGHVEWIRVPHDELFLNNVLKALFERNILSLIVEGGKQLLETFLRASMWDEARVLVGEKNFSRGIKAPVLPMAMLEKIETYHKDLLFYYKNFAV